jgi:hypothetical protein
VFGLSVAGIVDHFAIEVDRFDKESVTRELKRRGANPDENLDAGFHVEDPRTSRADCSVEELKAFGDRLADCLIRQVDARLQHMSMAHRAR